MRGVSPVFEIFRQFATNWQREKIFKNNFKIVLTKQMSGGSMQTRKTLEENKFFKNKKESEA